MIFLRFGRSLVRSGHFQHALFDEEEGDQVVALFDSVKQVDCGCARPGLYDSVLGPVVAPEIAFDRVQDLRLVVNTKNCRCWH